MLLPVLAQVPLLACMQLCGLGTEQTRRSGLETPWIAKTLLLHPLSWAAAHFHHQRPQDWPALPVSRRLAAISQLFNGEEEDLVTVAVLRWCGCSMIVAVLCCRVRCIPIRLALRFAGPGAYAPTHEAVLCWCLHPIIRWRCYLPKCPNLRVSTICG